MDGVYNTSLYVTNSGTPDAYITFKADECATPILEGPGVGPTEDDQAGGVGSAQAEYLRFEGIVARGWNIGFGNGWAGGVDSDEVSNGHWEIEHCISYSNGRTGFTFFSAPDFTLKHSISAHNGSSQVHSWSSGVTLFEATGTTVVEGNISFENTDAERHTDGSGFIADEGSNGASFINNIAFGNAGSCLRLTDSSGTRFINNTCYHNSQFGSQATGPSNPSELYFTNAGVTVQGVTFTNNVIVGTGQAPAGAMPVVNQPQSGWSNNVVATGNVAYFTDATGTNPDFTIASGNTDLSGEGAGGNGVPTDDIGFDPKCIVKRTPVMVGQIARESWWQYDIDIEYIQSIGGVAGCFNPAARSGTPDVGAYSASAVSTITPGSCIPPVIEPEPTDGAGGTTTDSGATVTGSGGTTTGGEPTSTGGASTAGTTTGTTGVGGATQEDASTVVGTVTGTSTTGTTAGTQTTGAGPTSVGATGTTGAGDIGSTTGAGAPATTATGDDSGCACRLAPSRDSRGSLAWLTVAGLGALMLTRRRRAPGATRD